MGAAVPRYSRHSQLIWKWASRSVPRAHSEFWEFARKEMETPDVPTDTRLNKAIWAKGIRNVPHHIHLRLSRKCIEDKDKPNKLCMLVTCHHFQNSTESQCG